MRLTPGSETPSRDPIARNCGPEAGDQKRKPTNRTQHWVTGAVRFSGLMAFSSFSSQSFSFLELGHTRKYREELSTAIQERSRMLGAFSHPLKPFTEVEESEF